MENTMNKKVQMSRKALEERFFNRYSKIMEECQMWTNYKREEQMKGKMDNIENFTRWINDLSIEAINLIKMYVEIVLDCTYNSEDEGNHYFKVKNEIEEKFWHNWYHSSNEIKKVLEVK